MWGRRAGHSQGQLQRDDDSAHTGFSHTHSPPPRPPPHGSLGLCPSLQGLGGQAGPPHSGSFLLVGEAWRHLLLPPRFMIEPTLPASPYPAPPPPYDAKGAGRKTGTAAPSQSGVSAHRLFSHSQPPPNVGAWGPGLGCSVRNTSQIMREISQQSRETWSISLMERTGPTPDGSPVCPL